MPLSSCYKNQGWKPTCTLFHLTPGPSEFSSAPPLHAEREQQPQEVCVHAGLFLQKTAYSCVVYGLNAAHYVVKCSDCLISKNRCKAIYQQRTCSSIHFSQISPQQDSDSIPLHLGTPLKCRVFYLYLTDITDIISSAQDGGWHRPGP